MSIDPYFKKITKNIEIEFITVSDLVKIANNLEIEYGGDAAFWGLSKTPNKMFCTVSAYSRMTEEEKRLHDEKEKAKIQIKELIEKFPDLRFTI